MGFELFIWVHFGIICPSILLMGFKSSFEFILASFDHLYCSWDSSLSFEFILASFVHPYCSWDSSLHLSSFWHHLTVQIAHDIRVFIWVYFGIICPSILLMGFKSLFEFIWVHFGIICPSVLLMGFDSTFEFILASFVRSIFLMGFKSSF